MASRKPYECFKCRDNGFPNTMVFLAGKDEQGKTIYIEEDGIGHRHKTKGGHIIKQQQQPSAATTNSSSTVGTTDITEGSSTAIKIVNAKLDRIINLLLESRGQTQEE